MGQSEYDFSGSFPSLLVSHKGAIKVSARTSVSSDVYLGKKLLLNSRSLGQHSIHVGWWIVVFWGFCPIYTVKTTQVCTHTQTTKTLKVGYKRMMSTNTMQTYNCIRIFREPIAEEAVSSWGILYKTNQVNIIVNPTISSQHKLEKFSRTYSYLLKDVLHFSGYGVLDDTVLGNSKCHFRL